MMEDFPISPDMLDFLPTISEATDVFSNFLHIYSLTAVILVPIKGYSLSQESDPKMLGSVNPKVANEHNKCYIG